MRLNRFLASCGLGSRRGCEALIREGRVIVNGSVCRDLSTRIGPGDRVECDGRILESARSVTLAFHKPPGFLCTARDERGRPTIYDLLPREFHDLRYVGRLDKESEGLLILTSDGDLVHRLTHPSGKVEKEYEVSLDRSFDPRDAARLLEGFPIEPGLAKVASVEVTSPRHLKIVLLQGLKRQVRLMLEALGYEVRRLVRTRVGSMTLEPLAPGKWRRLSPSDLAKLT